MPDASVTSLINREYATPMELAPKRRTNSSARRLARPLSVRTREMSIAASTSHADAVPSRTALLAALLPSLAAALAQFSREGFAPFRDEWLRLHAWQGRRVALSMADRRVAEGKVVGVAEDGALMLASARGVERFHSGELSLKAR